MGIETALIATALAGTAMGASAYQRHKDKKKMKRATASQTQQQNTIAKQMSGTSSSTDNILNPDYSSGYDSSMDNQYSRGRLLN